MAEPIEMPFRGLIHVGPRDHVLDGGQGWMNPLAVVRAEMMAMRPFVKILCPLVILVLSLHAVSFAHAH